MAFLLNTLVVVVVACSGVEAVGLHQDSPMPAELRIDRLVIYKSKHCMEAWSGKTLIKTYAISTGSGNPGPKRRQGDKKTPEGRYRITKRFVSKKFHKFLHLSYPNETDRQEFQKAKHMGLIPAHAKIGGSIGIHGEKEGYGWLPHKWVDWTQGCIAVDNEEIEELYRTVVHNAVVIIYP